MDFSEPQHKKIIGIMYIVFSALGLLFVFGYDFFMENLLEIAMQEDPEVYDVMWIFELISGLVWGIAILFLIPRIIIGIGLVQERSWANIPALVYGVISLINFPLGTLLGVYAIVVFMAKPKEEIAH